jgi:hypothetical protein
VAGDLKRNLAPIRKFLKCGQPKAIRLNRLYVERFGKARPIDRALPFAPVAFAVSVIGLEELNRWLRETGVPVQIDGTAVRGACNPQRDTETSLERRARLAARREELKAAGVRNFNQVLSKEEGVSISRIQQYLRAPKGKTATLQSWLHGSSRNAS